MKNKINKICTELNDGKIAVVQATEQLFDLYSVSQQRELLIAFDTMREFDLEYIQQQDCPEILAEDIIKAIYSI
jgi:hypothetical protein